MSSRRIIVSVPLVALLSACAAASSAPPDTTGTTTGPPVPVAGRGWIDGEPDWAGGAALAETADAAGRSSAAAPTAADDTATARPDAHGPLRAGSVDDNADLPAFLDHLARIDSLGIERRSFDPSGRVTVSVADPSGRPVAGIAVSVTAAGDRQRTIATLRTTADGTARFLPALYGAADVEAFDVTADQVTATVSQGGSVSLTVDTVGIPGTPVPLDVLFLIDATGSMGDEIDRLKTTIDGIAAQVAALDSRPDVRFAFTLYRDEGDLFVTATFDFTSDVDEFRAALADVVAGGGGDYPEALEEGLAEALATPAWRAPGTALPLMFVVGDAPPRFDRQVPVEYPEAIRDAVARGIKVFPIASSESDDQAEVVFRSLAVATGARFVFLSYGAAGAATGASSDIDPTDYAEMALDQLVVRLVAEELAALTGSEPAGPAPVDPPPTSRPDGQ